ncbi:MAG: hypothetical protein M0Z99_32370, partial [Betaproteobacteria bacterium]|nr:hypothetical protein [Betaproteobacteria bacterium]
DVHGRQRASTGQAPHAGAAKRTSKRKNPSVSMAWVFCLAERVSAFANFQHRISWDDLGTPRASFQREIA